MTASSEPVRGLVCPRCRSRSIEVLANSPVEGVWTIHGCGVCFYAWRSTEPEENTDPDKYPAAFRLKPADLEELPAVPLIPPLRRK